MALLDLLLLELVEELGKARVAHRSSSAERYLRVAAGRGCFEAAHVRHEETNPRLRRLVLQDFHDVEVVLFDRQASRKQHYQFPAGVDAQGSDQVNVLVHAQAIVEGPPIRGRVQCVLEFLVRILDQGLECIAVFDVAGEVDREGVEKAIGAAAAATSHSVKLVVELAAARGERRALNRDQHARCKFVVYEVLDCVVDLVHVLAPSPSRDVDERAAA